MRGTTAEGGAEDRLALAGRLAPILILGYAAVLLALRHSLSPYLEVDEAQFVGHVDLRLVYANSHPPLYNWLLRATLELTGWNWALSTGAVKYALLGGYYLLIWDIARRLDGSRAGLLAVAAAAFLPQVVWMSVHTLAHSTMVLTGAAATAHAVVVLAQRPSRLGYVWLGLALATGALAKYNFFLFAVPMLIALLWSPVLRPMLLRRQALISAGVFGVMFTPVLIAAAANLAASSGRIEKLYRTDAGLVWYDLPGVGLDGLLSFALACAAWVGPLLLVWLLARRWDGRVDGEAIARPQTAEIRRALGRAILIAVAIFSVIVLAADMHRVHERYLTPILALSPVWLASSRPLGRSAAVVTGAAAALFAAALAGFWGMANFGAHRYGYDYDVIADAIRDAVAEPAPLVSGRHDDAANVTLALGWTGATEPLFAPVEDRALLLWRGENDPPEQLAKQLAEAGLTPGSEIRRVDMELRNFSGKTTRYSFQAYERSAASSSGAAPGSE